MADTAIPEDSLKILPAMLNLVFIQTGKILRESDLYNDSHNGLTRRRINEFIPPANERFHEALDELEISILQAKAVLERDMSLIRKKRAERARKAGVSTVLSPEKGAVESQEVEGASGVNVEDDVQMSDELAGAKDQTNEASILQQATANTEAITAVEDMPQDLENSAGLAISIAPNADNLEQQQKDPEIPKQADEQLPDLDTSATLPIKPADVPSEDPQTDNFDEFESMFNDADFPAGDTTINFEDMDFSTDNLNLDSTDNINLDSLGDSAFPDISMSNADIASVVPNSNEDINSLLPGLENFVNAGADASATNAASAAPAAPLPEASQVTTTVDVNITAATTQAPIEAALADSSFDDFFNSADLGITDGADTGTGTGTGDDLVLGDDFGDIGAFDEDWFKD